MLADEDDRFAVRRVGSGRYLLTGALSFVNARAALQTLAAIVREERGQVLLDLGEVTRADSAGLALLIESMRLAARHRDVSLRMSNLPAQVEALATVSGVDAMLPRVERADCTPSIS